MLYQFLFETNAAIKSPWGRIPYASYAPYDPYASCAQTPLSHLGVVTNARPSKLSPNLEDETRSLRESSQLHAL